MKRFVLAALLAVSAVSAEAKQNALGWLQGAPLHIFVELYAEDIEAVCDGYVSTQTVFGDWGQYTQGFVTARCPVFSRIQRKPRDIQFDHGIQMELFSQKLEYLYISTDCIILSDTQIMLMRYMRIRCQ